MFFEVDIVLKSHKNVLLSEAAARTTPELFAERLQNSWPDSLNTRTKNWTADQNDTVPSLKHDRATDGFEGGMILPSRLISAA